MTEFFQQLLAWVSLHPVWAGITVFLVAMAESLAIVGVLVPGVVMMFGIGALISAGVLEFWPTFSWAVAGAVAGDGLSFYLGRHYERQLRGVWPISSHPEMLERGIVFFERYGGKSIVFGRFVGPVRAIIPLVAGMMGMTPGRFLAANLISALAWAPAYLLPGMVFGASLELASEVAMRLVILLVTLIVLGWFLVWLIRILFRLLHPHASNWVQRLLQWSSLHPRAGDIAAALADPDHPEARGLAILASLLILTTALFALIFYAAAGGNGFDGIDRITLETLQSLRTPWADHLMLVFSRLAGIAVILPLMLAVTLFFAWRRNWRLLNYWLAASAFALLSAPVLKYSLQLPRPELGITGLTPYAFPSSHVMRATVVYGFLAVIIARALDTRWRWLPYGAAGLLILFVSLARLYLGVHWLSDVLGSLTLGIAWVTALGLAHYRHLHVEAHWRGLTIAATLTLIGLLGVQTWHYQARDMAAYTPVRPVREMTADGWWDDEGWKQLPVTRQDIRATGNHLLNVQYAGSPDTLKSHLEGQGWQPAEMLAWENSLKLLSPSLQLSELPLLPQVNAGRHETMALVKQRSKQQRLVLRLWPSGITLEPEGATLWTGSVTSQQKTTLLSLFAFPVTAGGTKPDFQQLLTDIAQLPHRQPDATRQLLLMRGF